MELYSLPHSPYAARVRIQIYHRELQVSIEPPPDGLGSAEFKALTPGGQVPTLHSGGEYLGESAAIMEFLEDSFPVAPLRSDDPWLRARERGFIRFIDLDLAKALFPLFQQLRASPRDEQVVSEGLSALAEKLQLAERWLGLRGMAPEGQLSFSDCALYPVLFYITTLAPMFGEPEPLANTPAIAARWQQGQAISAVAQVVQEMAEGLKAMTSGG